MIVGITGTSLLSAVIPGLQGQVDTTIDNVLDDVKAIDNAILNSRLMRRFISEGNNTNSTGGFDGFAGPLVELTDGMKGTVEPFVDQALEIDGYRTAAMIVVSAVSASTFVFLALGGLLGFKKFAWPLSMCPGACCGFLVWLLFGLHFPIGVFLADVCTEIDEGGFVVLPFSVLLFLFVFASHAPFRFSHRYQGPNWNAVRHCVPHHRLQKQPHL
jgi:hypothetical protein